MTELITDEKYNQMRQALIAGQITEAEWQSFCQKYLRQLLQDPEVMAMLKRMKEND